MKKFCSRCCRPVPDRPDRPGRVVCSISNSAKMPCPSARLPPVVAASDEPLDPQQPAAPEAGRQKIGATATLIVHATHADGTAAAGVWVRCRGERSLFKRGVAARRQTDDEGEFTVQFAAATELSGFTIEGGDAHPEHRVNATHWLQIDTRTHVILAVPRGTTVARSRCGVLTGAPVAGADVFVGRTARGADHWLAEPTRTTKSGADGRFELLAPRQPILDHGGQGRPDEPADRRGQDQGSNRDRRSRGRTRRHRVGRGTGGRPSRPTDPESPGQFAFWLRATRPGRRRPYRASSPKARSGTNSGPMADGRFRVRVIADLRYSWEVQHPEHPMLRDYHGVADSPFELRLAAGKVVAGRVFRSDGTPASGAEVVINDYPQRVTTCAADGSFRLFGIGLGKPKRSWKSGERTDHVIEKPYLKISDAASAIHVVQPLESPTALEIHLERPEQLRARVVDTAGNPIVGARVAIDGEPRGRSRLQSRSTIDLGVGTRPQRNAHRRPWGDSRFRVCIEASTESVSTCPAAGSWRSAADCRPATGEPLIRVDPADLHGAMLVGSVRDALTDRPIESFDLTPWYEGQSTTRTKTVSAPRRELRSLGVRARPDPARVDRQRLRPEDAARAGLWPRQAPTRRHSAAGTGPRCPGPRRCRQVGLQLLSPSNRR